MADELELAAPELEEPEAEEEEKPEEEEEKEEEVLNEEEEDTVNELAGMAPPSIFNMCAILRGRGGV